MTKRKGNYKYEINTLVRYRGKKAQVLERWWDDVANNRYMIKFMVGRNLAGDYYTVLERNLERYD